MEEEVKTVEATEVVEPAKEPDPQAAPANENPTPAIVAFVLSLIGAGCIFTGFGGIVSFILGLVSNGILRTAQNIVKQPFRTFTKVSRIINIFNIILGILVFIIVIIVVIVAAIAAAIAATEEGVA